MKTPTIHNFEIVYNKPTSFCIQLTPRIRLFGQRHSTRSGSYTWHLWFEKHGTWQHRSPMGGIEQFTGYARVKANAFRGIILAKSWSCTKAEIFDIINSIPA